MLQCVCADYGGPLKDQAWWLDGCCALLAENPVCRCQWQRKAQNQKLVHQVWSATHQSAWFHGFIFIMQITWKKTVKDDLYIIINVVKPHFSMLLNTPDVKWKISLNFLTALCCSFGEDQSPSAQMWIFWFVCSFFLIWKRSTVAECNLECGLIVSNIIL